MLGGEGVTHLVKKRLGVLNRSIFQELLDLSGLMIQPSTQAVQHRSN